MIVAVRKNGEFAVLSRNGDGGDRLMGRFIALCYRHGFWQVKSQKSRMESRRTQRILIHGKIPVAGVATMRTIAAEVIEEQRKIPRP